LKFQPQDIRPSSTDLWLELERLRIPKEMAKHYLKQFFFHGDRYLAFRNDCNGYELYRRDEETDEPVILYYGQRSVRTFKGKGKALLFKDWRDYLGFRVLKGIGLKSDGFSHVVLSNWYLDGLPPETEQVLYFNHLDDEVEDARIGAVLNEAEVRWGTMEQSYQGHGNVSAMLQAGKFWAGPEPKAYYEPVINRPMTQKYKP